MMEELSGCIMCLLLTAQLDEVLQAEEEGSNVCPTPPQKAVQLIFDFSVIVTYYFFYTLNSIYCAIIILYILHWVAMILF